MDVKSLLQWIEERERIRILRTSGAPPPWTDDPILQTWSFCNVRREDDRATTWIRENWREPHVEDEHLWFGMMVARFLNLPATLAEVGYPVPWDRERVAAVLHARQDRGDTVFGPAYKIVPPGKKMGTIDYVVGFLLDRAWQRRQILRPRPDDCLEAWCARLREQKGIDHFMAGQIAADMKYASPLKNARDWMTYACSGPGSRRGLNRVIGRDKDTRWKSEANWFAAFTRLREAIAPELELKGIEQLHAQDLQSCLCEFDKNERARLGEGKPKRRFAPRPTPRDHMVSWRRQGSKAAQGRL